MAQTLTPWLIQQAYSQGIFPMTMEDGEVGWFQPDVRAIFPMTGVHVSTSLRKKIRRLPDLGLEIRFDTAFEEVMRGCLRPDENWISEEFIQVYTEIHRQGWGHSGEVWRGDRLVGGIYGIALGSCFCAESMFHRETDCSKIALWAMVRHCRSLGFTIFDAQIMNPHLERMGAIEIEHWDFMSLLEVALLEHTPWSL